MFCSFIYFLLVAGFKGTYYLIDCIYMETCNHATLAQTVIRALTDAGVDFNDVTAFVTDNAPYCIKAYREGLKMILPNSVHVCCLAHILNLVGEVWHHWKEFAEVATVTNLMKTLFTTQPARKRRYKAHLAARNVASPTLPPVPVASRWNTWFEAVKYHAIHVEHYHSFFMAEASEAQSVLRIIGLLDPEGDSYDNIKLQMNFIAETCPKLMHTLTTMEATHTPVATRAYNLIEDCSSFLRNGCHKVVFGDSTDEILAALPRAQRNTHLAIFHNVFQAGFQKLSKHWDQHPAKDIYKQARIFDPRRVGTLSDEVGDFGAVGLTDAMRDDFNTYRQAALTDLPRQAEGADFDLAAYWRGMEDRTEEIAAAAQTYMYFPVSSVDTERSFSKYKNLVTDKRENLTEENTKQLVIMNFNGDVSGRWADWV